MAYASGYVLTRRTLPLGGAGALEVLLTLSLNWVGMPLTRALAGVVVYRVLNLVMVGGLAVITRARLIPLLSETAPPPAELTDGRGRSVNSSGGR